jgi:hypothetical protein
MKMAWILALLILTGCAHQQVTELRQWAEPAKAQAKRGEIKWSVYYLGLYDRVAALPEMEGKAFYLRAANILHDAALSYEEGKVAKREFESFQREMTAAESEYVEQAKQRRSERTLRAARVYNEFLQTQAMQTQRWRMTNCTSHVVGNQVNTTCF